MNTYIKNLIQKLYELYGYNIIEFKGITGLCSSWGVSKKQGDIDEIIFFTDLDSIEDLKINELINYVYNSLQYGNIRLIQVLIDSELKVDGNESEELNLNHRINPQCEFILINNVDNKILFYSSGLEDKVQELVNCINQIVDTTKEFMELDKSAITYILIILNLLVYSITAYLSGSILDSNINVLIFLGAKVNELINRGEYYRLITCMFLHGGIIHVVLNMYALNSLGPLVETVYGRRKYILIYFLSGIVSSIFSYKFSSGISVGASGAIFGLLGATLVFGIRMKSRIGKGFMTNILSVIAINLFIGFSIPNVDNFGHLGGLLGGMAVSYFYIGIFKA